VEVKSEPGKLKGTAPKTSKVQLGCPQGEKERTWLRGSRKDEGGGMKKKGGKRGRKKKKRQVNQRKPTDVTNPGTWRGTPWVGGKKKEKSRGRKKKGDKRESRQWCE